MILNPCHCIKNDVTIQLLGRNFPENGRCPNEFHLKTNFAGLRRQKEKAILQANNKNEEHFWLSKSNANNDEERKEK